MVIFEGKLESLIRIITIKSDPHIIYLKISSHASYLFIGEDHKMLTTILLMIIILMTLLVMCWLYKSYFRVNVKATKKKDQGAMVRYMPTKVTHNVASKDTKTGSNTELSQGYFDGVNLNPERDPQYNKRIKKGKAGDIANESIFNQTSDRN